MKEATRIKMIMEWDELKALNNYLKSVHLHRKGIHDTIEAYEYATAALFLNETVQKEEKDVEQLRNEASQLEQQADFDNQMSTVDGRNSFQNGRASVGSRAAGFQLAKQAEEENERSELLFNRTSKDAALGKEMLVEAQKALLKAEMGQNATGLDKGICYWASKVCSTVRSNNGGTNSSTPAQPSDDVIKANRDIQNALQIIHKAEEERSLAIELHRNASLHHNMSTSLLADAMAFENQGKTGLDIANEHREKAQEEEAEAKKDEQLAEKEEADIAMKEAEIEDDNERSSLMFRKVGLDHYEEAHAIERMNQDMEWVDKRRAEWGQKMEEAKHHISRAGWEALVASISGLCLLVLVATQIIATFRYQQPVRWILREPPFFKQDLCYLICHGSIFLLIMGFFGELFMDFQDDTIISRAAITIVFALCATYAQLSCLHFPYAFHESGVRECNYCIYFTVMKKVVIEKGVIIAPIFAIEMLLCWCWMGTTVFTQFQKLNNGLMWFVVFCMTAGSLIANNDLSGAPHWSNAPRPSRNVLGDSSQLPTSSANNDERDSLLGPSFSGSPSGDVCRTESPDVSYGSPPSMHSVPFGDSNLSSMDFSWNRDLIKVRLLFEFWLASLALWIIRRDLELIRKLSPLSAGLVWGMAPLWIVNICLFLIIATLIVSLANIK